MPERWLQVERIYGAVVARPESEWATVLAELCAGDDSLRHEVESLLEHENAASTFLETPAFVGADVAGHLASERRLVGRRFGHYTVLAPIGSGGMGEVYRARDEQLGRQVAIKLLPSHFASDPDRRARLESEARILAALNHPHISAIYGVEEVEGCPALVLEFVEGETLAERLATSPLPLAQALAVARQIAEALEAAHERGIIHRDLKPANIKITPDGVVKILDFGLAKFGAVVSGRPGGWDAQSAATQARAAPDTRTGLIFGTLAYMSPEQATGRAADTRSDLFAFGVVLLEMLTGRPAFTGETDADVLESVLHAEPDLTRLPAETPAAIRRLLRRCLEKDRTQRLDSAAVARFEIDDAIASPAVETPPSQRASRRITPLAIAALASVALLTALAVWILMRPPLAAPVVSRFAIVTPPAWPLNTRSSDRDLALSPDGRYLVYRVGTANVGGELIVRAIDQLEGRRLAGIFRAFGAPFFSPDSRWIGFFEYGAIKKVAIAGGPVITLGPVTGQARGASWGVDNTIVFATDDPSTGLWRVSADGGEPEVLTRPDATRQETDHLFPSVLPNGRGVVFTIVAAGQASSTQLAVLDLGTGRWRTIVSGGTQAEYVAPSTRVRQGGSIGSGRGHLVYAAADSLRAIEFDPIRLDVRGDPVTVAEDVLVKPTGSANYAVSFLGTLVYIPRGGSEARRSLAWVDRRGREEALTNALLDFYNDVDISSDGTRVAIKIGEDIWIRDLASAMWRRLTFDPRDDSGPHWTPDGRRIIFVSDRAGAVPNVYSQAADGTGTADRLTTTVNAQYATALTPGGTAIIGFELSPKGARSVIQVRLTKAISRPGRDVRTSLGEPVVEALFEVGAWPPWPDISRDGRYLAYESAESGQSEVYVRPFPHVDGGRWQVSTGGGTRTLWARSGRELFYLDASNKLTAVPVQTSGQTFIHGSPTRVSEMSYVAPSPNRHFDESPDGRLLVIKTEIATDPIATPASMVVVEHWLEELEGRTLTR